MRTDKTKAELVKENYSLKFENKDLRFLNRGLKEKLDKRSFFKRLKIAAAIIITG